MVKPLKPKKCKNRTCRNKFVPDRPFVEWCSPECGAELVKAKIERANELKAKKARIEHREAKVKAKTRGEWIKEVQSAFNAFIRARDSKLSCVSCGRFHEGQWHAGHYMPTSTRPSLRFSELNVWKQCSPCNLHKHGNLVNYRIELINRIGLEKVEWLEGIHEPQKYTIQELVELKAKYKQKLKELHYTMLVSTNYHPKPLPEQ